MRLETLIAREFTRSFRQPACSLFRAKYYRAALLKVVDAECGKESRSARSWQYVAWPCTVVAQRFGTVAPHEYGARVINLFEKRFGVGNRKL